MFRAILALVALSAFATAAFALPPVPTQQDVQFDGKVMAVTANSITIMGKLQNDVITFAVTPQTKITYGGEPAQLIDIQMGDQATITGNVKDEGRTALAIVAHRRK